jgi:hypothetical protein
MGRKAPQQSTTTTKGKVLGHSQSEPIVSENNQQEKDKNGGGSKTNNKQEHVVAISQRHLRNIISSEVDHHTGLKSRSNDSIGSGCGSGYGSGPEIALSVSKSKDDYEVIRFNEHGEQVEEEEDDGFSSSTTPSMKKKNLRSQMLMEEAALHAYPPDHFSNRLYKTPKWKPKEDTHEAIVSNLSYDSLRWIKKRRTMDSNQRVVISYIRNRQLREMFKKLDFNGHGSIELEELTDAIHYVKSRITEGDGVKYFQNLDQIFADMDDNGDGTVDYQEFTKGMTGTSNSVFDKISAFDIEKLFMAFIEYGEMRGRELAVENIDGKAKPPQQRPASAGPGGASSSHSTSFGKLSMATQMHSQTAAEIAADHGLSMYQNFKSLFGNENGSKSTELQDDSGTPIWLLGQRRCEEEEKLLDAFVLSNQLNQIGCVVNSQDSEVVNSMSTVSGENFEHEKLYMQVHEKQKHSRRDMVMDLATDFGILDIHKQMKKEHDYK